MLRALTVDQNNFKNADGNTGNDVHTLSSSSIMPPKSPFFNFDEKLSLNEREKGTYEGYMTEDGIEAPN